MQCTVVALRRAALVLLFVLAVQLLAVEASTQFDAHRLVQYDRHTHTFGSRRAILNNVITTVKNLTQAAAEYPDPYDEAAIPGLGDAFGADDANAEAKPQSGLADRTKDLARKVALIRMEDLDTRALSYVIEKRGAAGIVVLLRADLDSLTAEESSRWRRLERFMLSHSFEVPIYFAFENQELNELYQRLSSSSSSSADESDRFQVVASAAEASVLQTVAIHNFHGWLHSAPSANADADSQPTIALVANYDTFAVAPSLAAGASRNGGSVLAILETARIFSKLYHDFRTQGSYNLLFVLTGGGRYNFAGTKQWLRTVDSRVLESIEFALCLEGLGVSEELHLHYSKAPKTDLIRGIYKTFEETASDLAVSLSLHHRKINVSQPLVSFQHEHFSRKAVVSATLSGFAEPAPLFQEASILDRKLNVDLLARQIEFVAETVARLIYQGSSDAAVSAASSSSSSSSASASAPASSASAAAGSAAIAALKKELRVVHGSRSVSSLFLEQWSQFLTRELRVTPFLAKNSALLTQLEATLSASLADVKKTAGNLDVFKFYKPPSLVQQLTIHRVKPLTFDLSVLVAIVGYLAALYFSLVKFSRK